MASCKSIGHVMNNTNDVGIFDRVDRITGKRFFQIIPENGRAI